MNQGVKTIIYPVTDAEKAKVFFNQLLGVQPYADQPYYIGYKVEGQDIGLDPNGHKSGMTGPIAYYHIADIKATIQTLVDNGGQVMQDVRNVGGGRLIASVKDADGNVVGLIEDTGK